QYTPCKNEERKSLKRQLVNPVMAKDGERGEAIKCPKEGNYLVDAKSVFSAKQHDESRKIEKPHCLKQHDGHFSTED
ncbi:MAG: hypothetical protein ACPHCM_05880, partial [Arenicellales bacterium]